MIQTIVAGEGRQPVARLGIAPGNDGALILSALLPLGLSIQSGVRISVDDGPELQMELIRCLRAGCIARRVLSLVDVTALRGGTNLPVRFTGMGGGEIELEGSLSGISAAMDATKWGS